MAHVVHGCTVMRNMRRTSLGAPLLASGALAMTGCAVSAGVAVVPTVDTTGAVGLEAKGTVRGGLGDKRWALLLPFSVGGGVKRFAPSQPTALIDGGVEYVRMGSKPGDLGFRASVVERTRFYPGQPTLPTTYGVGLEGALLPAVWTTSDETGRVGWDTHYFTIGPTAEASWMVAPQSFGRFGVGLTVDWYHTFPVIF